MGEEVPMNAPRKEIETVRKEIEQVLCELCSCLHAKGSYCPRCLEALKMRGLRR
jgi:hypothetical protein